MRSFWELLQKPSSSFALIMWAMVLGIVLACLLALYEKRVIGGFVRKLLRAEAFSPESARTLAELGYAKNPFVRAALHGKTALSALVYMPGEDPQISGDSEEGTLHAMPAIRSSRDVRAPDARFYIPEPLRHRAQIRFEQHGTHWMAVVAAAVLFSALAAFLIWAMPRVANFLSSFFARMRG